MTKKDTKEEERKEEEKKKQQEAEKKAKEEARKAAENYTPQDRTLKDARDAIKVLAEGVAAKDRRLLNRVNHGISSIRRRISWDILSKLVTDFYPEGKALITLSQTAMMEDDKEEPKPVEEKKEDVKMTDVSDSKDKEKDDKGDKKEEKKEPLPFVPLPAFTADPAHAKVPEVQVYVHLLILMHLVDKKHNDEAWAAAVPLFIKLNTLNRRTADLLSAKGYYYYTLAAERVGKIQEIRNDLLAAYRTAGLEHNEPGQAVLTNALLRNYLHYNLFEQAEQFRLNATFPEKASNAQHSRYLYYTGYINAIQLAYSSAFNNLTQAIRKAPSRTAIGFRQNATKLLVIVQLLLGEIPERNTFRQKDLKRSLIPYLRLTQAMRVGDVAAFNVAVEKYRANFVKDRTLTLIGRLRHNVIKTGLRKICLSYSRISIKDIKEKLHFENEEDAEYVVAKAIADGVIDASIDRKARFLFSRENLDVYGTVEPQNAFHKRIEFCNDIHASAVKAMAYPHGHKPKTELDTLLDDNEEEIAELVKAAADEEED